MYTNIALSTCRAAKAALLSLRFATDLTKEWSWAQRRIYYAVKSPAPLVDCGGGKNVVDCGGGKNAVLADYRVSRAGRVGRGNF
jgi:hypothetical protein